METLPQLHSASSSTWIDKEDKKSAKGPQLRCLRRRSQGQKRRSRNERNGKQKLRNSCKYSVSGALDIADPSIVKNTPSKQNMTLDLVMFNLQVAIGQTEIQVI